MLTKIKNLAPDTDVVVVEVRGHDTVKVTISRAETGLVRIAVAQGRRVRTTVLGQEDEDAIDTPIGS